MRLEDYILTVDGVFTESHLDTFMKTCQVLDYDAAKVVKNTEDGAEGTVDTSSRVVGECPLRRTDNSQTKVNWHNFFRYKICYTIKDLYIPTVPTVGIHHILDISVLKYEEGGFYEQHSDHGSLTPRTLSVIIFLNDDYEGGEFEIFTPNKDHSQKIKPKKGRMVVFPSNFLYPHQAHPVKKGTRYVIVSWLL